MRSGLLMTGLLLVVPTVVLAGATSPLLVLSAAAGTVTQGAYTVRLDGDFEFANAVQVGYPLEVVVFQETNFVRFPIAGAPVNGTSPTLNDGVLAEAEVPAFLGDGQPAPAGVRIVTIAPLAVRVTLSASFNPGPASALLFTVLPEGTVLSNQLPFVLP